MSFFSFNPKIYLLDYAQHHNETPQRARHFSPWETPKPELFDKNDDSLSNTR